MNGCLLADHSELRKQKKTQSNFKCECMAFHMGKLIWFCLLSSSITLPKHQGPEIEFFKANVFVMLVYSTTTFGLTSSKTKWFVILWCSHLPIFKIGLFRNILVYCVLVELFLRKYFRGRKELFHLLCIAKDAFMSKRRRPTSRVVEGLEKYSFFFACASYVPCCKI